VAEPGDTVAVHYTGRLGNGTVFGSSVGGEPLRFVLGQGSVIVGFEQAILGMRVGESKTVVIPAADAYGPHLDELVVTKSWAELPPDWEPKLGDRLPVTQPNGQVLTARVVEITESGVTLDANHPLAGKDLTFDIELVELTKP
jgi:peptidylprolyl isomerase